MNDMDLGLEESPKKAKGGLPFIAFLVGIAIGVAGTLLAPRYLGPYLPAAFGGGGETLEGRVLGKRSEEGRLLLTVDAAQGAVLATFSERVAEIDLLVDVGDTITLGAAGYEPFIDDPAFRGVRKTASTPDTGRTLGAGRDGSQAVEESGDQQATDEAGDGSTPSPAGTDTEEAPGDTLQTG